VVQVLLGIGSNIDRERHIASALDMLADQFGRLRLSSVYESEAVGFAGDSFYNLVAAIDTAVPVAELSKCLRAIENANGRRRDGPRFSARTLDIDILTYGAEVGIIDGVRLPRPEILENAFVLLPVAELVPEQRHPETGQTYQQIWQLYDRSRQKLWPVAFTWRGQQLSRHAT